MTRVRIAAVAAPVLVALALTGCGGGEEPERTVPAPVPRGEALTPEEYQARIVEILGGAERATELYTEAVAEEQPQAQCARLVRGLEGELAGIVAAAEETRPPPEVAALHAGFLEAAGESVAEVGRAAERVEQGDLACGEELNAAIYDLPSTRRAERILEEIEGEGYFVFGQ